METTEQTIGEQKTLLQRIREPLTVIFGAIGVSLSVLTYFTKQNQFIRNQVQIFVL